jgi:hypothetical protein
MRPKAILVSLQGKDDPVKGPSQILAMTKCDTPWRVASPLLGRGINPLPSTAISPLSLEGEGQGEGRTERLFLVLEGEGQGEGRTERLFLVLEGEGLPSRSYGEARRVSKKSFVISNECERSGKCTKSV